MGWLGVGLVGVGCVGREGCTPPGRPGALGSHPWLGCGCDILFSIVS